MPKVGLKGERIIEIVRRTDSRLVVVPLMDKNYAEDLLKFHRLCNWITVISETCVKTMVIWLSYSKQITLDSMKYTPK